MAELVQLFQDPTFRLWYIAGGVVLLAVPMLWLSRWYHRNIGKSEEGRALMQRQRASRPRLRSTAGLSDAAQMARDIAAGRYGDRARSLQNTVYWLTGLWLAALILYLGLLLWADEMARI